MSRMRSGLAALGVAATFGLAAALVAADAGAQERPSRADRIDRAGRGPAVETVMSLRERLELSEDQIARLDEIRADAVERRSAERAELDEMRSRLRAGQIRRSELMAFVEDREEQVDASREELRTRIDAVLEPEQLETLEQIRAERRAFERGRRSARHDAMRRGGRAGPERAHRRGPGHRHGPLSVEGPR